MTENDMPLVLRNDDERGVTTLTLNRPNAFNALSESLLIALQQEIDALSKCSKVRVVIISAIGKAFCAGQALPTSSPDYRHPPPAKRCLCCRAAARSGCCGIRSHADPFLPST